MASHGAMKDAATLEAPKRKLPPKELEHIRLTPAENGGVSAEHHFTAYEHKPEVHVFGDGDGKSLAAHLQKHLGINMLGKASSGSAEPDEHKGEDE